MQMLEQFMLTLSAPGFAQALLAVCHMACTAACKEDVYGTLYLESEDQLLLLVQNRAQGGQVLIPGSCQPQLLLP